MRLADARAVHNAVESPQSLDRCLRRAVAHLGIGDVTPYADGLPSRGSDVKDVALDAMGAALFLLMAFVRARHSAVGNRQSAQEAEVVGGRW